MFDRRKVLRITLISIVLLLAAAFLKNEFTAPGPTGKSSAAKTAYTEESNAALNSRRFVLQSLKAPSTAKFPPTSTAKVERTPQGTYIVSSYVNAQNGFGATIRSNYVVEIKYLPGDQVQLVNIYIE